MPPPYSLMYCTIAFIAARSAELSTAGDTPDHMYINFSSSPVAGFGSPNGSPLSPAVVLSLSLTVPLSAVLVPGPASVATGALAAVSGAADDVSAGVDATS